MSGQATSYGTQPFGVFGLTALGTNQSSALLLPGQICGFTNVAPGTGCRSPAIPSTLTVINDGLNVLSWYPPSGDQFQGLAVNQPIQIPPGQQITMAWFGSALDPAPRQWVQIAANNFLNSATIKVTPGNNPLVVNGNTASPPTPPAATEMQISGATGANAIVVVDGEAGSGRLVFRRTDGSFALPAAVGANETLGSIRWAGWTGAGYVTSAASFVVLTFNGWSVTDNSTQMIWSVTPGGSTTLTEAMRLQASGILTIGATTASGAAKLQITGGTSTDTLTVSGNTGFFGTAATTKPTVTGSKGANAALASLMTALAGLGLVTDSTS